MVWELGWWFLSCDRLLTALVLSYANLENVVIILFLGLNVPRYLSLKNYFETMLLSLFRLNWTPKMGFIGVLNLEV